MTDHALDLVTLAIDGLVPANFDFAVGLGRNAAAHAFLVQGGAKAEQNHVRYLWPAGRVVSRSA